MSAEEVAKAFVQHFYQAFDTDVNSVAGLYVSLAGDFGSLNFVTCFGLFKYLCCAYEHWSSLEINLTLLNVPLPAHFESTFL